jgi:hypothetical protein
MQVGLRAVINAVASSKLYRARFRKVKFVTGQGLSTLKDLIGSKKVAMAHIATALTMLMNISTILAWSTVSLFLLRTCERCRTVMSMTFMNCNSC